MSDVAEMVAWLRCEIEADRAAALAATPGPWTVDRYQPSEVGPPDDCGRPDCARMMARTFEVDDDDVPQPWRETAAHIARHDPQDVIADADAKLAILDDHMPTPTPGGMPPLYCGTGEAWSHLDGSCVTLRLLAQGYRHRDGWRKEWTT